MFSELDLVDINGLDKVELLRQLWFAQTTAFYAEPFDSYAAQNATRRYIDYFCGRPIKCDLSSNFVDPYLYDRDAGKGVFQAVVDRMGGGIIRPTLDRCEK